MLARERPDEGGETRLTPLYQDVRQIIRLFLLPGVVAPATRGRLRELKPLHTGASLLRKKARSAALDVTQAAILRGVLRREALHREEGK